MTIVVSSMVVGSFSKIVDKEVDYKIDWASQLDTGDTISVSAWEISPETSPPLVKDTDTNDDDSATIFVSGGAVGEIYSLKNTITTVAGRIQVAEIVLRVSYLELGVTSFVTAEEADQYFALVDNTTWMALKKSLREAYLLRATRLLDRQRWRGTRTSDDQLLAWPRTGISIDGVDVDEDAYPQRLKDATCEIALALANSSDVENVANSSQKIESLRAGSVAISYFRGAEGSAVRFPQIIQELLRDLLASGQAVLAGIATGTDGESVTANDFGLNRGL